MCSSGDQTVKQTEKSQADLNNQLKQEMLTTFGQNQALFAQLSPHLLSLMQELNRQFENPEGMSPEALAAARTTATDLNALQFEQASRGANTVAAAHGGAALPSGVTSQIAGEVAAQGARSESAAQNQITLTNEQMRQSNKWAALQGEFGATGELLGVAGLNNPVNYANAATGAANSVSNLGQTYLASQQAGWADLGGIISGVAGLGSAAVGAYGTLFPATKSQAGANINV
jgi:hypothetical protein